MSDMRGWLGLDISSYQYPVDWARVKQSGRKFVIIKAGEAQEEDPRVDEHITGAAAEDFHIGLYWFSWPHDDAGRVRAEANRCCDVADRYRNRGIKWMPLFLDLEGGREEIQTATFVQACARMWCDTCEQRGYKAGVYYNYDYQTRYYPPEFWAAHPSYYRWFAFYDSGPTSQTFNIWQYSAVGQVPGIAGNVDLDKISDGTPDPPGQRLPVWLLCWLKKKKFPKMRGEK